MVLAGDASNSGPTQYQPNAAAPDSQRLACGTKFRETLASPEVSQGINKKQ
jgi:hypothetical protein